MSGTSSSRFLFLLVRTWLNKAENIPSPPSFTTQPHTQPLPLKLPQGLLAAGPRSYPGRLQQLPAQSWTMRRRVSSHPSALHQEPGLQHPQPTGPPVYSNTHTWTPVPASAPSCSFPCQTCPPRQPLPCSLRGKRRLWLEATHRSWADQVTDSAWSDGIAHPASVPAIMAQQKPSTCKCSPELLGERHHSSGFPCSPGQCLAGAWPRQPVCRPCLSPGLAITPVWPSASGRSFPRALESPRTLSLVPTHTWGSAAVAHANHGKTWDLAELLRCV